MILFVDHQKNLADGISINISDYNIKIAWLWSSTTMSLCMMTYYIHWVLLVYHWITFYETKHKQTNITHIKKWHGVPVLGVICFACLRKIREVFLRGLHLTPLSTYLFFCVVLFARIYICCQFSSLCPLFVSFVCCIVWCWIAIFRFFDAESKTA